VPPPIPTGYPIASSSTSTEFDPEQFTPPTTLLPKLFTTLSDRYASRSGGYTRIHRFGRRPGDNAPHCILSLVDGPKDLKFEMLARAVGKETVRASLHGVKVEVEGDDWAGLRERTKRGVEKVLKFGGPQRRTELEDKAKEFADLLLAENRAVGHRRASTEERLTFRPTG
jgi:large subunit ribosomal protein L17